MQIKNHILEGVKYIESPNRSGLMTPTLALMHYTAGYSGRSAIATLTSPRAKVSAHLVIDTDGTITQLVPFNRVAWHAGRSAFEGRQGVNNFSIGFEFVNPGFFKQLPNGGFEDAYGTKLTHKQLAQYDLTNIGRYPKIGGGTYAWPAYTEAQIAAGLEAFHAICDHYPITDVTGHENVDLRGWKTDPGPAFPMARFVRALAADNDRQDANVPVRARRTVGASRLRVRDKPGLTGKVVTVLSRDSEVIILEDTGKWSKVEYAPGRVGWIADQYLK